VVGPRRTAVNLTNSAHTKIQSQGVFEQIFIRPSNGTMERLIRTFRELPLGQVSSGAKANLATPPGGMWALSTPATSRLF
jgi:hypothetical protein